MDFFEAVLWSDMDWVDHLEWSVCPSLKELILFDGRDVFTLLSKLQLNLVLVYLLVFSL